MLTEGDNSSNLCRGGAMVGLLLLLSDEGEVRGSSENKSTAEGARLADG